MKILFRVDAGDGIGLGHFARSVALANQLNQKGHDIYFVCQKSKFWISKIQSGFPWEVFFLEADKKEKELLKEGGFDLLYVDGNIAYTLQEVESIKEHVPICMYQNLTDSRVFADVFILPSIHQSNSFFEEFNPLTKVYQGLSYFTFNESLCSIKPISIKPQIQKIGVIAGGSDPKNILLTISQLIEESTEFGDIIFHFYFGESYLFKEKIPKNTSKSHFVSFDYDAILTCDLVICAFGVTTYELLALGIPTISLGHQESTSIAGKYLSENTQALLHLGLIDDLEGSSLCLAIHKMKSREVRKRYSEKAKSIVDLQGVNRVVELIESNFHAK